MSLPDGTGAARRAVAAEPQTAAAPAAGDPGDDATDQWFAPAAAPDGAETDTVPSDEDAQAQWFLPAGRAGLLPDSVTDSWDGNGVAGADLAGRQATGAPPWGRDSASAAAADPPPWENGPWPGPGEPSVRQPRLALPDPGTEESPAADLAAVDERRQRMRLILAGGAGAVVLVVVIVVIVVTTTWGSGAGCATYPAAVRQAYARAMSDLSGRVPASVQGADLQRAASLANASAAAASQLTARSALFTMASDLDQAFADVTKHRALTPGLQQKLTADGTALPRSC